MFKEKIKPSLVLTLICLVTCALLVIAYEATYVDSAGVMTDGIKAGLNEIYGSNDGFYIMKNDDGTVFSPEGITCVISDGGGNCAFEITTDGYSSGGLHVLVGIDPFDMVRGVSILSIGETPGLGTRVQNPDFLSQFRGLTFDMLPSDSGNAAVKPDKYEWWGGDGMTLYELRELNKPSGDSFELDAVTGATFSSKGMNRAVTMALNAYNEMKEVSAGE